VELPNIDGQRVLLDFEGSMTSTTPFVNGTALAEAQGGYLPFSYDVTNLVHPGTNQLAVIVDGTWQSVPPDGRPPAVPGQNPAATIDYLEPAGLYRHVGVRLVPAPAYLNDIFVDPSAPPTGPLTVPVVVTVDTTTSIDGYSVSATMRPWGSTMAIATAQSDVLSSVAGQVQVTVSLANVAGILRWSLGQRNLYSIDVSLIGPTGVVVDTLTTRTGFRQAEFTSKGFFLNGERVLLFGLNRHQLYPYMGMAMPDRVQRHDAEILVNELNCNAVRCSHYPQSRAFLDACDELGLLAWQETPGWGYIGDNAWQGLWFGDVSAMVARDRSRPSVVIWGVQPNETLPARSQALESKSLAQTADPGRPSSGSNSQYEWQDYFQDVLAYDDYNVKPSSGPGPAVVPNLSPPVAGKPYLVSESVGAIEGVHIFRRAIDQLDQQAQAWLHGLAHSQAQDPNLTYAGLLGWCAFDYASLAEPGWGALKTPGVADTFRILKPGAAIYQSQVAPQVRPVIQPAFYWDFSPTSPVTGLGSHALVFSNCERLEMFLDNTHVATLASAATLFPNLSWPPFYLDTSLVAGGTQPDLRLDGYVGNDCVLSRNFAGSTAGDQLSVQADDAVIFADGSDATRIWFLAVDRFGAPRPYVTGTAQVSATGPGIVVGDRTFDFAATGGAGAVWLRSAPDATGQAVVQVTHARLGQGQVQVLITDKQENAVYLEDEMFVRNPTTGEICLCSPAGAFNLGNDWPTIVAAYAAAGVQIPIVNDADLQQRFQGIASH
jgi:beta-galactosidase